jgi:hypothetical protein
MTYDHANASASAFFAVSELTRLLRGAVNAEQEIRVEVESIPSKDGKDGFRVLVETPPDSKRLDLSGNHS